MCKLLLHCLPSASGESQVENVDGRGFGLSVCELHLRGLLEKYPTFGREKETGLLGALDT